MIHTDTVEKYSGTMNELVEDIGNLRYDALSYFIELLAKKLKHDGDKDQSRGRVKLASHLYACSENLNLGKLSIDKAWEISEPFMK